MSPGAPGPAPASHTQPGSKAGKGSLSSRANPVWEAGAAQGSADRVGMLLIPPYTIPA